MTRWLLDSNAIIAMLNQPRGSVAMRARDRNEADLLTSSVVLFEMYFGAFRSERLDRNLAAIGIIAFEALEFDADDARAAGLIRANLVRQGRPIGPYDLMLAGQALARDLTLVTNNTREFSRVEGLKLEDWSLPPPA